MTMLPVMYPLKRGSLWLSRTLDEAHLRHLPLVVVNVVLRTVAEMQVQVAADGCRAGQIVWRAPIHT